MLNLSADGAEKVYLIKVIDLAGNIKVITYTVAAEWTKTGIMPAQ